MWLKEESLHSEILYKAIQFLAGAVALRSMDGIAGTTRLDPMRVFEMNCVQGK